MKLLLLSFALSFILRVPNYKHAFVFIDEAWWANGAKVLAEGGQLYRDVWLDKQPPIFIFCALFFKLAGSNVSSIHLGSFFLVIGVSFLLYLIGSSVYSRTIGGAAALLYSLASTMFYTPRIIGMNTETLMIVFTSAAMYCFLQGSVHGRPMAFFLAGLFASLATITKQVAITQLGLFSLLLAAGVTRFRDRRFRSIILLASGCLCGIGLFAVYLAAKGLWPYWWAQSIVYEFQYVGQVSGRAFIRKFPRATVMFILIYAWMWILIWRGIRDGVSRPIQCRVLAWWLVSTFIGVAVGRRFYANYFIQMMPPMSILAGVGLTSFWRNWRASTDSKLFIVCCAAFLFSFVWFHSRTAAHWYYMMSPSSHHRAELWGTCRESRKLREISHYLESHTAATDRIFVWGSKPELYFLSRRRMATMYMEYDVGADVPPGAADSPMRIEVVTRLRQTQPRYIVDVQTNARIGNFSQFRALLKSHYHLEKEIHYARLYRLND